MEPGMGGLRDRRDEPGGTALVTRAGRLMAATREEGQAARRLWAGARRPGRSGPAAAGAASAAAAEGEHPPPIPDPRARAVFDGGNTLSRGASGYHVPRGSG